MKYVKSFKNVQNNPLSHRVTQLSVALVFDNPQGLTQRTAHPTLLVIDSILYLHLEHQIACKAARQVDLYEITLITI